MSLSFGSITPRPVPDAVTEETLAKLAVPVARRLAFVLALLAFGVALLVIAVILAATGYLAGGPGAAGAFGTVLGFGIACSAAAGILAWAFSRRKTLLRPRAVMAPKTPETVADAWIGVGIMAFIAVVVMVLAAIFGGPTWASKAHNVVTLLPLALIGPGAVAALFLITGYTVGHRDAVFTRWLARRPLAQAEYAELRSQIK
ncbi:hypothetical protein AL755_18310 [Arthrobacter sp. ERGS1:01]|uniref:hypothetical protein n=1 Tax=Arthrobacter sp. ERGS1:01 TaxID=1704044 RepID=UPI0006B4B4D8|nr:hypothetical protein [Arthrobacter sp. ERGS1:01]ALE06956.1 hypothetical protein AL755_18310 [Arthrobacter sp. ERGS1:01]